MKKALLVSMIIITVSILFIGAVSAEDMIGGDKGKIIINSNAEGANVVLFNINGDEAYTGTIENGKAVIYVYSTGTPVSKGVVYGDGYKPAGLTIDGNPGAGQVVTYTVNLERAQPSAMGGSFGFIQVVTNVVGAKVELHDVSSKVIKDGVTDENGAVTFEVYTTGTPVGYVSISANGWKPVSVTVVPPQPGKTEVVSVTLESTSAPEVKPVEPEQPSSPMGAALGLLGVLGAAFLLRKE